MPDDQTNQLLMQAGAPTLFPGLMDYISRVASGDVLLKSLQNQFTPGPNPLDVGMHAAALDPQALAQGSNVALAFAGGNMTKPAWHGTPHIFPPEPDAPFGRFSNEAIGSGEGAQAYGYGHYVAGNKAVAEDYQKNLSEPYVTLEGKNFFTQHELAGDYTPWNAMRYVKDYKGDVQKALDSVQRTINAYTDKPLNQTEYQEAVETKQWLEDNQNKIGYERSPGALLEVHVLPEEHELLDWDKPLSEQSEGVQQKLSSYLSLDKGAFDKSDREPGGIGDVTGGQLYKRLQGISDTTGEQTSRELHEAGISGIRYLDAGSRSPRFVVNLDGTPGPRFATRADAEQYITNLPSVNHPALPLPKADIRELPTTHNYVIFDPSNLRIVGRNGERLTPVDHDPFAQDDQPK